MMLLASLVGIGSLICWVMVLIRLFKAKGALHGILGIICALYPFIWGWINANALGIKNIMLAWTACFVIGIPINFMAGAGAAAEMQKAIEEAQRAQGAATP
jgi:hypothetical protein